MTETNKQVTRVTMNAYPSRGGVSGNVYGKPRKIHTTLGPGDVIVLRYAGLRTREYIKIDSVMRMARWQRVAAEATTKRAAKKRRAK